ncbi:PREDICTED: uncharacterized protein LOC108528186 [Rhinopithecus bieti]|uniref:uncharacterized protein LOC108528186 n=1 Tax=Rhinopithecus bieti TaxID=61621 RepID=UPI00083BC451|nr:PREDICTED: uncharacterized protein LOC108528186 [Rhinopithecus bieti]
MVLASLQVVDAGYTAMVGLEGPGPLWGEGSRPWEGLGPAASSASHCRGAPRKGQDRELVPQRTATRRPGLSPPSPPRVLCGLPVRPAPSEGAAWRPGPFAAARVLCPSSKGPSPRQRPVGSEPRGREGAPAGLRGFRPSPSRRGGGLGGGALRVEVSRPRASLAQTSFNFLACSARPDVSSELQLTELYWTRRSSSPQVERPRIARCPGPAGPGAWGLCAALELGDHTARSPSLASSTRRCVSSTQCALAAVSRSLRGLRLFSTMVSFNAGQ